MSVGASPLLSVVIVAYQSHAELPACLASIPRTLAGRPVEVTVVDNSRNADGTGDLVRRDFPWVEYADPESNLGFGRANNLGFRRTTGEQVLFLNPDTVVSETALAHCAARVAAEPDMGSSPRDSNWRTAAWTSRAGGRCRRFGTGFAGPRGWRRRFRARRCSRATISRTGRRTAPMTLG